MLYVYVYSFFVCSGVVFYHLLTGQLPFPLTDRMSMIHAILAKQPTQPHLLNPSIPISLSNLIMKLLNKDASNRYLSSFGILHDLQLIHQQCIEHEWSPAQCSSINFTLAQNDVPFRLNIPAKLYGREQEIAQLEIMFDKMVHDGKPQLALVAGPAGIGK
jgi:serine/threonine protein kinase